MIELEFKAKGQRGSEVVHLKLTSSALLSPEQVQRLPPSAQTGSGTLESCRPRSHLAQSLEITSATRKSEGKPGSSAELCQVLSFPASHRRNVVGLYSSRSFLGSKPMTAQLTVKELVIKACCSMKHRAAPITDPIRQLYGRAIFDGLETLDARVQKTCRHVHKKSAKSPSCGKRTLKR